MKSVSHEFEVIGRAPPVALEPAPVVPAEAREDLLVIKSGGLFLCARPDGEVHPARITGEGLYANDTRHLSELSVTLGGLPTVLLSSSDEAGCEALVHGTNPTIRADGRVVAPQETINLRRSLLLDRSLYCTFDVQSFNDGRISAALEVAFAADFADVFEVRGAAFGDHRGLMLRGKRAGATVRLAYMGRDDELRETLIRFSPAPSRLELDDARGVASWELDLLPGLTRSVLVSVEPRMEGSLKSAGVAQRELPKLPIGSGASGRAAAQGSSPTTRCGTGSSQRPLETFSFWGCRQLTGWFRRPGSRGTWRCSGGTRCSLPRSRSS